MTLIIIGEEITNNTDIDQEKNRAPERGAL
jgi:hypothetical protein